MWIKFSGDIFDKVLLQKQCESFPFFQAWDSFLLPEGLFYPFLSVEWHGASSQDPHLLRSPAPRGGGGGGGRLHLLPLLLLLPQVAAMVAEVGPKEEVVVRVTNLCPNLVHHEAKMGKRRFSKKENIWIKKKGICHDFFSFFKLVFPHLCLEDVAGSITRVLGPVYHQLAVVRTKDLKQIHLSLRSKGGIQNIPQNAKPG